MKLKIGTPVIVTPSRNGQPVQGRFNGSRVEPSGQWIDVNFAPKGKPAQVKAYRPAQVQAA